VIEKSYNILQKKINADSTASLSEKEDAFYSFAFSLFNYLATKKHSSITVVKKYEMYNPYYYPTLELNRKKIDLLQLLAISVQNKSPNSFKLFSGNCNLE